MIKIILGAMLLGIYTNVQERGNTAIAAGILTAGAILIAIGEAG